jgi:hypothetical protein
MAKHLSIRLPWHDRGWDGHVCSRPKANVYCTGEYGLKAHSIRENKKGDEEEAIAGKACTSVQKGAYLPPCLRTIVRAVKSHVERLEALLMAGGRGLK